MFDICTQNGRLAARSLLEACTAMGVRCRILLNEGAATVDMESRSGDSTEARAAGFSTESGVR